MANTPFFIDGDTFVADGERHRLAVGNAPEVAHPDAKSSDPAKYADAPGGAIATRAAQRMQELGMQRVAGSGEVDRHGRPISDLVDGDGRSLANEMLAQGFNMPPAWRSIPQPGANGLAYAGKLNLDGSTFRDDPELKMLREQALNEQIASLQEMSRHAASIIAEQNAGGARDWRDDAGIATTFAKALGRGTDQMQGSLYGFVNAIGEVTGVDPIAKWGHDGMAQNIGEAFYNPAQVESWEDADTLADYALYGLEAMGEVAPQLVTDLVVAWGTGGAGVVLSKGALAGAGKAMVRSLGGPSAMGRLGMGTSMYTQLAGEQQMSQTLEGVDAPGVALVMGAPMAALDYMAFSQTLRAGLKGIEGTTLGRAFSLSEDNKDSLLGVLGASLKAAGVAAAVESPTEAMQTLMGEMAIAAQKDGYEINTDAVFESAVKAAFGIGGWAGAGRAVTRSAEIAAGRFKDTSDGTLPPDAVDGNGTREHTNLSDILPPDENGPQATLAEPSADIRAQLTATPEGEGNWFTAENAAQAKQIAEELGLPTRDLADGSVAVASEEVLAALPENPTQADIAKLNGYTQTKAQAAADPSGQSVVQVTDDSGAVLREQVVANRLVDGVVAGQQKKFPGARVQVLSPEDTIARRQARSALEADTVQEERAGAPVRNTVLPEKGADSREYRGLGLAASKDSTELVAKAKALGIDTKRFTGERGFGEALLDRVRIGMKPAPQVTAEERARAGKSPSLQDLTPLAEVLQMEPEQLTRQHYARGVYEGKRLLLEAVEARINELYGSPEGFSEAMDALTTNAAGKLATDLGVAAKGKGFYGVDYGALQREVDTRAARGEGKPLPVPVYDPEADPLAPEKPPHVAQADRIAAAVDAAPAELRDVIEGATPVSQQSPQQRADLEKLFRDLKLDKADGHKALINLLRESVAMHEGHEVLFEDADADGSAALAPTVRFAEESLDSPGARLAERLERTPYGAVVDGRPVGLQLRAQALGYIATHGRDDTSGQTRMDAQQARKFADLRLTAMAIGAAVRKAGALDKGELLELLGSVIGYDHNEVAALVQKAGEQRSAEDVLDAMAADPRGQSEQLLRHLSEANPGETIEEKVSATLEALDAVPEAAIKGLIARVQGMPEDLRTLYRVGGMYDWTNDTPVTARAADGGGIGQEAVANLRSAAETEQDSSDALFASAVQRATAKDYPFAVVPEDTSALAFTSGSAGENTRRFAGGNLLAVPQMGGTKFGRLVDAITLAAYAQSGEHAPRNVAEAASNLLLNASRLFSGVQLVNGASIAGDIRRFPDSLVIFINPETGAGETFGDALNVKNAQLRAIKQQREVQAKLESLEAEIAEAEDAIEQALGAVEGMYSGASPEVAGDYRQARDNWYGAVFSWVASNGQEVVDLYSPTDESVPATVRQAHKAIGAYRVGDKSISDLYWARSGALVQRKRLRGEKFALVAQGAKLETPDGSEAAALNLARRGELGYSDTTNARIVEQTQRSGTLHEVVQGELEDDGTREGEFDTSDQFNPYSTYLPGEDFDSDHEAMVEAFLRERGEVGASAQPHDTGISPRPMAEKPKVMQAAKVSRSAQRVVLPLLKRLRELGVPLPAMDVLVLDGKQDIGAQLTSHNYPPHMQRVVRDNIRKGSFYYRHNGTAFVVVAPASLRQQTADLLHEIGHAVKDAIWEGMTAAEQRSLAAAAREDLGRKRVSADVLHEWFADQFAKAVVGRPHLLADATTAAGKLLARLVKAVHALWDTLVGTPRENNPVFATFADRLFSGEVAFKPASAPHRVRHAAGERAGHKLKVQRSESGQMTYHSADGDVSLRGRRKIEATDRELENSEGKLKWGHAAWLQEGNAFWEMDIFTRNAAGRPSLSGRAIVQIEDATGRITAIHDVKAFQGKQGTGLAFVRAVLASNPNGVKVVEAISESQGFWDKMGALGGYDQYKNTQLTWHDFTLAQSHFKGSRGATDGARSVGGDLRGERREGQDPTGHEGDSGNVRGNGPTESDLDEESLAFLNDFLADDDTPRFARGVDLLRYSQRGEKKLVDQAKGFWQKGVAPKVRPIYSMVYSRIATFSPELSRRLFQPANTAASASGRSWEQRQRALKARMTVLLTRELDKIEAQAAGRKGKRRAVQAAFEDAYTGVPKTADGRAIQRAMTVIARTAADEGLQSINLMESILQHSVQGIPNGPIVFDRKALTDRPAEFKALLAKALPAAEVDGAFSRIVDGPGSLETAIAPGLPVGMHRTNRELVEAIGYEQLKKDGWLLTRHQEATFHWIDGLAKRAAWEGNFGAVVARNTDAGVVRSFDPNAKFKALLQRVADTHGTEAAREVMDLTNGALGRHPAGARMPRWFRSTQEFVTGWVGMTILAFSGIASIPELGLPFARAGGRVSMADVFANIGEARTFAKDMGIVLGNAAEQAVWQMTGDQYVSPMMGKLQRAFFIANGNALIVKTSRIIATGVAMQYIARAAREGDTAALERLGTDAATVAAWDKLGRPVWDPSAAPGRQAIAKEVGDAINQFVNEATLNPSRFQATHWGNNPYAKMIWHLKHFLYTYADTALLGLYREMSRRWGQGGRDYTAALNVALPALAFALAVLPLAAVSLETRDWIRRLNGEREKRYGSTVEYFGALFDRAGGAGPLNLLYNMQQHAEWGMSPLASLSPTYSKVEMLFRDYKEDGQMDLDELGWKLRQLTPVVSQNKGLLNLFD